jgi:GH24 family phage-related lysozyme (muramidase)
MNGPQFTQSNEGCTLTAKKDSVGWEIGWGHNSAAVVPGLIWSQAQADAQFALDYSQATQWAKTDLGEGAFDTLDEVRQAALVDMAYELGEHGLLEFEHMLAGLCAQDWQMAHDACLDSAYASQVPSRARKVAAMLLTGAWQ